MNAAAASPSKAGFALPSVLFVVAMVTLVFLVAIEALTSLAEETRGAKHAVLFQAQGLSLEADVAYATATRPLGAAAVMRSFDPDSGELFAIDGTPYRAAEDLTVSTQDEAGLINVDNLPVAALPRLFAALGLSPDDRTMMSDRLADYLSGGDLKRPQGAKADDYLRAGLPPPPGGPLLRRDQLLGVMGWSETWSAAPPGAASPTTSPPTARQRRRTSTLPRRRCSRSSMA